MAILELLGVHHSVTEILGGSGPTTKVVRVRLRTVDDVTAAVNRIRTRPIHSNLTQQNVWIQRARTPAEAARTAPIARAIRTLNDHLESERLKGARLGMASGRRVRARAGGRPHELDGMAIRRVLGPPVVQGAWQVNDEIFELMGVPIDPQEWHRSLL